MASGLVIAATRSGSGKTMLTLGLLRALGLRGIAVAPAKTGPDYIDTTILGQVAGRAAINLDPWAMDAGRLRGLASAHAAGADLLLVEGVMGLFDGAADGNGSTADLAATLKLPVVLVVDAERLSQSIAPLVSGFANWRDDVRIAGVVLNRVGSPRHELMLRRALEPTGIEVLGAVPRDRDLNLPERHLGLVLPDEIARFDEVVAQAARSIAAHVDIDALLAVGLPLATGAAHSGLPPLGQHIAVARDDAFAFVYQHLLCGWREAGASMSFFSPLADEAPDAGADAVFLPGGYPELHGARLAAAQRFRTGLVAARERGALIYGECGGYMVLGRSLTDRDGQTHEMTGLLPVATRIDRPRRTLGYRRLNHAGHLPWPRSLAGHEFHYSSETAHGLPPLFLARDAEHGDRGAMGAVDGRVMGSYAHVIEAGEGAG